MKRTPLAAAAVLLAVATTACTGGGAPAQAPASSSGSPAASQAGNDGGVPASRLDAIGDAGVLKVCTTGDYRPFTYKDPKTGKYSGLDVDMARDLAKRLGVKAEFVDTTWKDLMPDFLASCDIAVGGVSISLERAGQAAFSTATLDEGKTPITRCENVKKYDTIAEINQPGVRSITPIGGTNQKFAEEHYPRGKIIEFTDNNTIFDQIIDGKADVMTTDASETRWVANEHPELCAVHPDKPFNYSQKAYLLPRGDIAFKEYVDAWLNIADHDGTTAKAEKPWFG
ncbi:transporter substrate-binding domain-containing protein [Arthrobacter rhombi]|uniref:transporter substrate-binding domain-containing protein n=1 Tax=Arthrobacter rhombi TaxID=71253 RepID=UPI0031DE229A